MVVRPEDLIATGRELQGASYGQWDGYWPPSAGAPFWMYGAVSVDLVLEYGCNCAGFINAIRRVNGLDALGGTGSIGDRLINLLDFDVTTPAVPGAIALRPWSGGVADVNEGHVALYTSAHDLLQADHRGVNEEDSDYDSQPWAQFTVYGLMDDVLYEDGPDSDPQLWERFGWYEAINPQWDLRWHSPL